MTKKIFPIISLAAVMAVATGCSDEQTMPVGEGKVFISTRVDSDLKVESRAAEASETENLEESTIIWISNSEGVVRKYNGIASVPVGGVKLLSGDYTVKAWAGTAEYASWTSRWFEGSENFSISAGSNTSVTVACKIANVVASVNYGEGIDDVISDYSVTVSHSGGSLTFEGADERKGYFLMPEGVTALDYVFTATYNGHTIEKKGTVTDVEPAHEYRLNIVADKSAVDLSGAGFITITVDDTMVEVTDEITIAVPPAITGYDFDITSPINGSGGNIGAKSIYVSAASDLTSVELSGLYGLETFDFLTASDQTIEAVSAAGITHAFLAADKGQIIHLDFSATYLNSLPNSNEPYVFTIKATDSARKTTVRTLTLNITEAPVITSAVNTESIGYNSMTLEGEIAKEGLSAVGFEYRIAPNGSWTYIEASAPSLTIGSEFTAQLTDIPYDSQVEYRAVTYANGSVDFRGNISTAETKQTPQLPNSDMETWGLYGSVVIPASSYSTDKGDSHLWTWDTGNHGSSTLGINITQSSTAKKHGGQYSAELKSQFVGVSIFGKLACGNIVYGHYIKTDGMDGIFGFGNPFDFDGLKPTALTLWVHYTPVAVTHTATGGTLKKGDMDYANIFVALFDGPDMGDSEYPGQAGYVVRTKSSASRYFDRNAANVIGFGEIDLHATAGSDMIQITIPIDYTRDAQPTYIAVVCAASKEGDYYTGGDGSTLYVDDFRLVY